MTPDIRRLATLVFLGAADLPAQKLCGIRAGDLVQLMRALFAEERRADLAERLRREDRLDAAERESERLFGETPHAAWQRKGRTSKGRSGKGRSSATPPEQAHAAQTKPAPPTPGRPGESQGNLLFPPPTSAPDVDWPSPTG